MDRDRQMEPWQFSLEEYIRQGEPGQAEKSNVWQTAIGLQAVDGLKTSDYLLQTAREHIEGRIDIETVKCRIDSYYREQTTRRNIEAGVEEADKVSARIAEILSEKTFRFSPAELISIHGRLFKGVYPYAGTLRAYNITKKEWVLGGDTVYYASADSLRATLDYDFAQEKAFSYKTLSLPESVRHLAAFISGIWQIHSFGEGNTRTTAVFAIKYLRSFGFQVKNDLFAEHSWYFRNALVRANYTNLSKGIHATPVFLEMFFENLLMGADHSLKNRYLHIEFDGAQGGGLDKKAAVASQKAAFQNEKVSFEQRLWDMKASAPTKEKTRILFEKFGYDRAFSRSDLGQMFGMASSSAGKYLNKLKAFGMLEPVSGLGKGKYRFSK